MEANDSGNSIGHGGGKYRNKTKPSTALESGKTSWLFISDTPESSGATNGKSQLYQQAPTWYFRGLLFFLPTTQTGFFKP